jgi:hypothetical protein
MTTLLPSAISATPRTSDRLGVHLDVVWTVAEIKLSRCVLVFGITFGRKFGATPMHLELPSN